jgi:hypothetical protein
VSRRALAALVGGLLAVAAVGRPTAVARAAPNDEASEALALAARRALVIVRVLAYDKGLAARVHDEALTIVVVTRGKPADDPDGWLAAFRQLPKVRAGGHPIHVVGLALDAAARFAPALAQLHPAAVIAPPGLGTAVAAVRAASRAATALTFTVDEADVRRGLAVGIVAGAERDEIVVNLEAARAEGARLGAGLLQLARLVDEEAP